MGMVVVEGIVDVVKAMNRADERVKGATLRGMKRWAAKVIFDAQQNLRQNGSVVTGLLRQSGHVEADAKSVTFGFFDSKNGQSGYAAFVEFGRRSGKFPPIAQIRQWLHKKFGLPEGRELDSRAFLTARWIARHGTRPHPYFQPAIDKNRASYGTTIKDEVNKVLKG